jgi:glycosyltransferase involved in cell wall biosynthesis
MLSVIIPAFNEQERIGPTLDHTANWLCAHTNAFEIIVVDDGSTDKTCTVVRRFMQSHRGLNMRLIESTPNRGKGHVVRVGMLAARGKLRLFMDADNSTPISQLPGLLTPMRDGAQIAIGSRRAAGASTDLKQPLYRRLWSRLANRVIQAGLLPGIRDTQCGFKLFSAEAAKKLFELARTDGWGFDLEVLALAKKLGYSIAEVPVSWTDDRRTRIHPLRDAWRITREYLRIRRAIRDGSHPVPDAPACE